MMSPGQASSTVSRSCGEEQDRIVHADAILPVPDCFSFMPRRNSPEARRRNATRSRWLGSMLAWTLNTKPVTSSSDGSTVAAARRRWSRGGGAYARRAPTAVRARRNSSAPSRNRPASDGLRDRCRDRSAAGRRGPARHPRPACPSRPRAAARPRRCRRASRCRRRRRIRPYTDRSMPLKFSPMPTGQTIGAHSSCSWSEISSSSSNGSRASRSILLTKVMIGMSRSRQTSNSLRVCALDALGGVDHHHGGVGGGQRAVGVFGEILMARRVEQVEHRVLIFERHHRGGDRDAALLLDLHPVGLGAPRLAARLHPAGGMDRAAEQQQMLGQRGLAGVGMRDDRESPAAWRLRWLASGHGARGVAGSATNVMWHAHAAQAETLADLS